MATLLHADSRRMYSWWWDSHISPKNSKWLQENLTDMDAKVKAMIKLIEEDADSFARRAEMYYKKRPELMKLVEEFYRAYRALAERYDHATGVIRQAHHTMAEAFPNQFPSILDDSPASSALEADPSTPKISPPLRALFSPDDLQKDAFELSPSHSPEIKRNGAVTDDSDSATSRKGLKQLNSLFGPVEHGKFTDGRVRKGLNFNEAVEKEQSMQHNENHSLPARALPDSDRVYKSEKEIEKLKESLAKLEAEKEADLVQYQQSLERLSKLESEVSRAQEDSRGLSDRAGEAEAEVQALKESLVKLEAEKKASFLQYKQCLDRISTLEELISHSQENVGELNERASKAENEVQRINQDLAKTEADRDAALLQHNQSLELISDLRKKLLQAQEEALIYSERGEKAEREVETLKQAISKLTEENEAAALKYQECLDTIANLERKISFSQEEMQRLNGEIDDGVNKLEDAKERCVLLESSNLSLHTDLEDMLLKMGTQSQELIEKQKELGRLWTCIQEERLRFMEAETAFQTLQHVHSQAQEELRSLASELQNRAQVLRDMEAQNQILQDEVQNFKEENESLSDLNLSSAMSVKEMENVILGLRETKRKLEEEVELRVDQRNALQQEIYCIKEELNAVSKKHQALLEQVDAVGLNPEHVESSVKELQVENLNLKENFQIQRNEKVALLEKLEIMEQLIEKNAILESSLFNLSGELEGLRGRLRASEDSYQSLLEEKSVIFHERDSLQSQLQVTAENLGKLSEMNTALENSISDAHDELGSLKEKSKSFELSCLLLTNEKTDLVSEKDALHFHVELTEQKLKVLEKMFKELEEKHSVLEKEKEFSLERVKELQASLDAEKQEHANFVQLSSTQLTGMGAEICHLQEESSTLKIEFEDEQDRALYSLIEIFLLQKCVQHLEERNLSLSIHCQKLLEASRSSEKLITELDQKNLEQKEEVKFLSDQSTTLRIGMNQLLKSLNVVLDHGCGDKIGKDRAYMSHILRKLEDIQNALGKTEDENQHLAVEVSVLVTLLGQLRSEMEDLESEKLALDQDVGIRTNQILVLESEIQKHIEVNEELRSKVREGDQKGELLTAQVENLQKKLLDMQEAHHSLQKENSEALEENRTLKKDSLVLEEKNCSLEEENFLVFGEMFSLSNLSLIVKGCVNEKILELKELGEDVDKLHGVNCRLVEKLGFAEKKLEEVQAENLHLKHMLEKSEVEFKSVVTIRDQLNCDLANGKNLLSQKETELLEAEHKLCLMANEKLEFHKIVEDLHRKSNEIQLVSEAKERQILKLSEDNDHLSEDNGSIDAANKQLMAELLHLHEEHEKAKNREEILLGNLHEERNEITTCEMEAEAFFGELQMYTICQALFEEKFHELTRACESLENDSVSKRANIELLKANVSNLEGENSRLKVQLAACGPAISSLRESIASLEKNTCLHTAVQAMKSEKVKDAQSLNNVVEMQVRQDQIGLVPDAVSDLHDLQSRVESIEQAVLELERLAMQENSDAHANLEAAMRQIEELKSMSGSRKEHVKRASEISEAVTGPLTKDIILDQISECSSCGISLRENIQAANQMLELWETADPDSSIDMTVGRSKKVITASSDKNVKCRPHETLKKQKSGYTGSDFLAEKEVGVDKLEISKGSAESYQQGSKRKVLERLNSDVQKLTNLQITVQDLKRKVIITEKSRKGRAIVEFDSLKGQLEEADQTILKLFDYNGKVMKTIEDSSLSFDGKFALESGESENMKGKKISEQARRLSERIGRLQLEVQRIQFVLLKHDDEKESRGKARMAETKRRVLLRDYLYGGARTSQWRKKAHFCACVQPPTKED